MSQKNVPPLDCYNFETWEWVLIFFGRNVTDRVSNQRHITMPLQITCASALPGKMEKQENHIFTKMLYQCIAWIQSVVWFLQSFWLTIHTHDAVWLPKSCNQCIQPQGCWGRDQEKGSWQRCSSWTVLHTQCTSALSSGFPISQGNAEALERWGEKTKHHLISYFLSNTSAKNYRNWMVYVKTIASQRWGVSCQRWDVSWDTVYNKRMTKIAQHFTQLLQKNHQLNCWK